MRYLYTLTLFCAPAVAVAQEPTYWQDIRPIFRKHCTVCHSARNLEEIDVSGGLALDTYEASLKGHERKVILPGSSEDSPLHRVLVTTNELRRMPLDAPPLAQETVKLIDRWIASGAKPGKEPAVTSVPIAKAAKLRKLDVVLPTNSIPPVKLLPKTKPGKLELALKVGPLAPVTALAFSPDGTLLAVGSYGQVTVWDLVKAEPVKVLTNVLGAVNDVRFRPDGKMLAVAGGQPSAKGDLRLYQVGDWKLLATLRGHNDVIFSIAFNHDGTRLASGSFDQKVKIWDMTKLQAVQTFTGHSDFVYAVAFSPDGKKLVSASKDHTVLVYDLASGTSQFTFSGMNEDVLALAYAPDGKSVVSSGFESGIYWWNPYTGEKIKLQAGHQRAVHELAFSKDGQRLVSASADMTVRVWDIAGIAKKTLPVGSVVYAAAIDPAGKRIASGSFDGLVRLWDEATAKQLATLLTVPGGKAGLGWLALSPDGYVIGSETLLSQARLRMGGEEVAAEALWPMLHSPDMMPRAFAGEKLKSPFVPR